MAGDFNVNSIPKLGKAEKAKLDEIEKDPVYKPVLPIFKNEYGCMIKSLKVAGYELIDLIRQSEGQGKFNPTTFPENHVGGKKNPMPEAEGVESKSLDYIFLLKPTEESKKEEGKRNL